MTTGIERIHINSTWNSWRIRMSHALAPAADAIYQEVFAEMGLPLHDELQITECTKEEAIARYDWQEGIDVRLYFARGGGATLQEKFLNFRTSTVTFEERKGATGGLGAWYSCTAQYYFVGYARHYHNDGILEFDDWIILDLPALRRADGREEVKWYFNTNRHDQCTNVFRYTHFNEVPETCIIAQRKNIEQSKGSR